MDKLLNKNKGQFIELSCMTHAANAFFLANFKNSLILQLMEVAMSQRTLRLVLQFMRVKIIK